MSNNSAQKGLNPFDFFAIGFGAIVGVGWALSLNRWMANSGAPLYSLNGGDIYLGGIIIGVVVAAIITFMNIKGAASAAGFQKLMVVILLAAAVIAIVCGLLKFDMGNLQPVYENINNANHKSMLGGVLAIMTSAPFFMCGFETIPQAVEDADGDVKDVGKAVVMAVTVAAIFYAIVLFILGGAMPWQQFVGVETPAVSNLFRSVYEGTMGQVLYVVILIGTLAGLLTTWNGFFVAAPRLLMCLARANLVPKVLAKQNPKTGVPTNGVILCFILSLVGPFLGIGLIDPLTSFTGTACLTPWGLTCFCLIRLRKTEPDLKRPYRIIGGTPAAW